MVDAISTLTIQSTASRPPMPLDAAVPVAESAMQIAQMDFVVSSIRVDNLQNVAILEYRSSKTGEVVQQFPTQAQIDAFKRAEQLQQAQRRESSQAVERHTAPAVEAPAVQAPPAAPVVQAAPSPAPSAPAASVGGGVSAGTSSTQSVLA